MIFVRISRQYEAKDGLYNDLVTWLAEYGVGWPARQLDAGVGRDFITHLQSALWPLSEATWVALNDAHNAGTAPPAPELRQFFGRKAKDRPDLLVSVENLQLLFVRVDSWFRLGRLPEVSAKLKGLTASIEKYSSLLDVQRPRSATDASREQPARTLEAGSIVKTVEALVNNPVAPQLRTLSHALCNTELYSPLEANKFTMALNRRQR